MSSYDPLHVAAYYAAVFPARNDVYSHWVVGPDPEHPLGWRPVREPLTADVVLAGLSGKGPSISGYMIAPGSVSHVLAYDLDTDDGLEQAYRLALWMKGEGLPAYVETSRRGAHLWCLLDEVLPAVLIRSAAKALLQGAGLPDTDEHIEIRPGSDHVDARWKKSIDTKTGFITLTVSGTGLGHALRLPMMIHPKTGVPGRMFDASGESIGRTVSEVMLGLEMARSSLLRDWAERWRRPPTTHIPSDYRPTREYPEDTSTVSEILASLWGVPNARPGRSVKCPAHEDKVASLSILRDDKRVICKAGACVLNNDDHGRGTYELRKMAPANG